MTAAQHTPDLLRAVKCAAATYLPKDEAIAALIDLGFQPAPRDQRDGPDWAEANDFVEKTLRDALAKAEGSASS